MVSLCSKMFASHFYFFTINFLFEQQNNGNNVHEMKFIKVDFQKTNGQWMYVYSK